MIAEITLSIASVPGESFWTDGGKMLPTLIGGRPGWVVGVLWNVGLILGFFAGFVSIIAFLGIWGERKISARLQHRHGPNRVGPIGILQSLADGIKLASKEDLSPTGADRWLFTLAPYLAVAPVFAAFLAIPFGPDLVYEPGLSIGLFWVTAVISVEVVGVILAGWASNSKWSIYGAMREACQLVSYEIPLGLSAIVVVLAAGTLDLQELTRLQAGGAHHWLIFRQPFIAAAFFIFFIASLASNKRAPFDLPESDSELVAGYHTEYSGLRFSLFYLAEYAAMFVMGAVMTVLFFGGWHDPFGLLGRLYAERSDDRLTILLVNAAAGGIFISKVTIFILVQMWVRWTLPRPRIDQVLHACVKVLLPMTCVLLLGSAVWELLVRPISLAGRMTSYTLTATGTAVLAAVVLFLLNAFIRGRRPQFRLGENTGYDFTKKKSSGRLDAKPQQSSVAPVGGLS